MTIFSWRVSWVDPVGFIRQSNTAIADDNATYTFTIPLTPTSIVNGQTVPNTGTWRVNLTRFGGQIQQTARFTVHEPANPKSDVFVQKFASSGDNSVATGGNIAFTIVVGNSGPDAATAVHLIDSAPSGFSLVSFTQQSGPSCLPAATGNCTIASLASGVQAEFTAVYNSGTSTQGTYTTTSTVSSTTVDPNTNNNTTSSDIIVSGGGGGGNPCTLSCPGDISTPANTTDANNNPGAVVHFDPPAGEAACGTITVSHCNDCFFPVGTTAVTATSDSGDTCSFDVTVTPAGAPTITCPSDKTATADSNCQATVDAGTPTTTGNNVTVTSSRSDGKPLSDPYPQGVTTITWTATNSVGSASCTQTITVNDTTAPTITCPANITRPNDPGTCSATVDPGTATATDNCGTATVMGSRSDGAALNAPYPKGTTTITWTATDGSGNTASCTQTVTVNDTENPVITCPASIAASTDPGICAAHVDPGTATATDNCDTPVITATRSDGQPLTATYPKGTTTITWTATDSSGNHSSCSQIITVVDNEPPVIVFNGLTPSMWPPNHKYQTFSATNFVTGVTDNCDSISVSSVVITKVTSDEIENGNGDGNTFNDIVIAANCKSVQLRAEREGNGDGRVYTIFFSVQDSSGNTGTGTARVVVRHNPGETAVDSGPHYTVVSNCP